MKQIDERYLLVSAICYGIENEYFFNCDFSFNLQKAIKN